MAALERQARLRVTLPLLPLREIPLETPALRAAAQEFRAFFFARPRNIDLNFKIKIAEVVERAVVQPHAAFDASQG